MNQLIERVDILEKGVADGFERLCRVIADLLVAVKSREGNPANPRGNAPSQKQDDLIYDYVSAEKVNALVILCEDNLEKFVLLLEEEVYKECPWGMDNIVDYRRRQEYVNFIRKCVFKHYEVPECLRKFMWQALKECLNKRVRDKEKKAERF